MVSIADELAALRAKGTVKSHATNLSAGSGPLSTPDAEKEAFEARRKDGKVELGKAKDMLNRGSKGAAEASAAHAAKLSAHKKADLKKKAHAAELLKKGGSGQSQYEIHASSQTGKKKAEWEKKNETKRTMAREASGIRQMNAGIKVVPQAPKARKKSSNISKEGAVETESSVAKEESAPAPVEQKDPVDDPSSNISEEGAVETESSVAKEESAPAPVEQKDPVDDPVETAEDDVPDLEEVEDAVPDLDTAVNATQQKNAPEGAGAEEERQITNRNEKKARKMMTRLGMRPVSNIARVTLKAGGGRGYFFLDRPDVFTSVGGKVDTYVIFGEAKQGGMGGGHAAQAQAAMAQQQAAMAQQQAMAAASAAAGAPGVPGAPEVEDVPELARDVGVDGTVDEEGVEAKDIDLVMSQASCSRAKAVAALKENDGDLVNAIMSLTT